MVKLSLVDKGIEILTNTIKQGRLQDKKPPTSIPVGGDSIRTIKKSIASGFHDQNEKKKLTKNRRGKK